MPIRVSFHVPLRYNTIIKVFCYFENIFQLLIMIFVIVHRKSDEQLARLKPRIQMHYVKKKKAPMENIKDQSPPASSSILLTASPAPPSSPPRVSTPPLSLSSSLPSPALLSTSQAPLKTLITLETSASPQTSAPTQTSQTHAPSVISTVSETSATTLQLERSPSSVINKSDQVCSYLINLLKLVREYKSVYDKER